MKRKEEQRLWDTMKNNRPSGIWMERVENIVSVGTPDVDVMSSFSGRVIPVELKAPKAPSRAETRLLGAEGLNKDQVNWHLKAASHSVPVYTLIRCSAKRLFLVHGRHAATINDMTAEQLQEVSEASTWPEIFEVLK